MEYRAQRSSVPPADCRLHRLVQVDEKPQCTDRFSKGSRSHGYSHILGNVFKKTQSSPHLSSFALKFDSLGKSMEILGDGSGRTNVARNTEINHLDNFSAAAPRAYSGLMPHPTQEIPVQPTTSINISWQQKTTNYLDFPFPPLLPVPPRSAGGKNGPATGLAACRSPERSEALSAFASEAGSSFRRYGVAFSSFLKDVLLKSIGVLSFFRCQEVL